MNLQGNVGQVTHGLMAGKILEKAKKASNLYFDQNQFNTVGYRVKTLLAARDIERSRQEWEGRLTSSIENILSKPGGEDITVDEAMKGGLL